jgi:RNA polymerase sigma factor (sigma-70 family)
MGDERLARLAAGGDRAAFGAIFARYHQPLYRYCRSILNSEADAADALQSTMLRALHALEGDTREIALRPWLYRIAFNESITLVRRRESAHVAPDLTLPARLDVEADVELRARFSQLVADMRELPERQRGALAMREMAGLEYTEIAAALETSPAAAKQAIYAARRALHELARGRDLGCDVIRDALTDGDGRALRGRALRSHLRSCGECRDFHDTTARRRSILMLTPAMPLAVAKRLVKGLGLAGGGGLTAEGGILGAVGLPAAIKSLTVLAAGAAVGAGAVHTADRPQGTTTAAGAVSNVAAAPGRTPTAARAAGARDRAGGAARPGAGRVAQGPSSRHAAPRSSEPGRTRADTAPARGDTPAGSAAPGAPSSPAAQSPAGQNAPGGGQGADPDAGGRPAAPPPGPIRQGPSRQGPVAGVVEQVVPPGAVQGTVRDAVGTVGTTVDTAQDVLSGPLGGLRPRRRAPAA